MSLRRDLKSQFDGLIRRPLSACQEMPPTILIVLDALDECSPETDVEQILLALSHADKFGQGGPQLRIFIASRPEPHIRFIFNSSDGNGHHEKVVLHDIDEKLARNDIRTYLKAEFVKLSSGTRDLPQLPINWPSPEDFEKLLNDCGKFFAYAATRCPFY